MKPRLLTTLVAGTLAVAAPFVLVVEAYGQPPRAIPTPPTPPAPPVASGPARASNSTAPAEPAPYPAVPAPDEADQPADYQDERVRIWNSPEMVQARQWLIDRSLRSARTSPQQVYQYLGTLQQLSPTQQQDWLNRFHAERANVARAVAVERAARQMAVEDALGRLASTREAYANINLGRTEAAQVARQRLLEQQLLSQQLMEAIRTDRAYMVAMSRESRYDPMAPTLDPASASRLVRSFAAATLPGDLPPSDSRNFIRGEEGIDTGEGEPAAAGTGGGDAGAVEAGGGGGTQ